MKKLLVVLSLASLMATVACNKSEKKEDTNMDNMQQEESRSMDNSGDVIEQETIETEDNMGRPVEDVEIEEVEREVED